MGRSMEKSHFRQRAREDGLEAVEPSPRGGRLRDCPSSVLLSTVPSRLSRVFRLTTQRNCRDKSNGAVHVGYSRRDTTNKPAINKTQLGDSGAQKGQDNRARSDRPIIFSKALHPYPPLISMLR